MKRADAVRAGWLGDTFLSDKVKLQNPPWARGGFEKLSPTPRKDVENTRRRRRQAVKEAEQEHQAARMMLQEGKTMQ